MVQGKKVGRLGAEISAGHFSIMAGMPQAQGGDDDGPTPHDLEAALTACTIITAQMYADRKQMKLNSTQVTVKIDSETTEATALTRTVHFDGDLTDEERQRLLEIVNKCPIHRLLKSQISIQTTMA